VWQQGPCHLLCGLVLPHFSSAALLSHLILNFFDFSGGQAAPQRHVRRVKKLISKLPRRKGSKLNYKFIYAMQFQLANLIQFAQTKVYLAAWGNYVRI